MDDFLKGIEIFLGILGEEQSPKTFIFVVGLSFARLISFFSIVPFFGGAIVSGRIKISIALTFIIILYPSFNLTALNQQVLAIGSIGFIALLVKEIIIGYVLGFIVSLIFEAIQVAGRIIDLQRGSAMAELYAPQMQDRVSEIGQFYFQLALMIFIVTGTHHFFIKILLNSFEFIPLLSFPSINSGWSANLELIVKLSAGIFSIGIQLAIPPLVTLFLTDLFFGIINRVAPQINVFFLSMPVKMMVGIVIIAISLPLFVNRLMFYFAETFHIFEQIVKTLFN